MFRRILSPIALLACLALATPGAEAAFKFNGTTDCLTLPAVPNLGDFTIACRFSVTPGAPASTSGRSVFGADDVVGGHHNAVAYSPDNASGGAQFFVMTDGVGKDPGGAPPSAGLLHTIVVRRSGTTVLWWLDGVRVASASVANVTFTMPPMAIGAYDYQGKPLAFHSGLVDRFSLWSRAWTVAEVAAFQANPDVTAFADQTGLVYDLPLDTDTVERHAGATVATLGTPAHFAGAIPAGAPPPATPPPVARIRAGWPKISPDGGLIAFLFESISDSSDAPIATEFGGAAIKVNGGAPIPLVDPLYAGRTTSHLISYPLRAAPEIAIVDDADAVLTGSWDAYTPGAGFGYHGTGVRWIKGATGTLRYPFKGLTPGTYTLAVVPAANSVPGNATPDASYSCDDGVGAAQVLHQDQTAPNIPVEDFLDADVYWQTLGTVTVSGTTLDVTLANAAGTAYLWGDAVRLEKVRAPVIPEGATVTLDAPAGWATVGSGDVAGATARAVPVATVDEWFGYNPDLAHPPSGPLRIGRNHNAPFFYTGCRLRANLLLAGDGPSGISGDAVTDANRNITGLGTATGIRWRIVDQDGMKDGYRSDRRINALRAGTWKVRYHGTANTPAPVLVDGNNFGLFTAVVADGGTDAASGKTVKLITVTLKGHLPVYPILTELQFPKIPSDADIPTGVELFDPDTPADWGRTVHPLIHGRERGELGFDTIRFLDPLGANGIGSVDYADLPSEGWAAFMKPYRVLTATIAAIEPVDTSADDRDGARALFGNRNNKAVVKVTTAAPHNFRSNHYVSFAITNNALRDNAGGTVETDPAWADFIHVLSPTQFLALRHTTSGAAANPNAGDGTANNPPLTLAGPFAFGTGTVTTSFAQTLSPKVCVKLCNDLDVTPWLNIPHTMSDRGVDDYADAVLSVLDPGRKVRIEYANEPWNTSQPPYKWLEIMAYRTDRATGSYFNSEYTRRAVGVHDRFRARWVAAGRDPADVIRVMGSQSADGSKTQNILDVCKGLGATFDELCLDTYVGANAPLDTSQPGYAVDPTEAFDRLDEGSLVSLMGVNQRYTDWGSWLAWHRGFLDDGKTYPGFSGVRIVSYEGGYQQMCPYGSNAARWVQKSLAATRHPYVRPCYQARLQMLERGWTARNGGEPGNDRFHLYCHYIDDGANLLDRGAGWVARPAYYMDDGAGDGSDGQFDNRKGYFAYDKAVSVQGQAEKEYAALAVKPKPTPAPDPTPKPTPNPDPTPVPVPTPVTPGGYSVVTASLGTVGVAQTVTVTLDRPGNATVTLASPDGMFTSSAVKFAASAGPAVTHFIPTRPGTLAITTTNDAGLTDPEPAEIEVVKHLGRGRGQAKKATATP